jgi:hypothetical protein
MRTELEIRERLKALVDKHKSLRQGYDDTIDERLDDVSNTSTGLSRKPELLLYQLFLNEIIFQLTWVLTNSNDKTVHNFTKQNTKERIYQ